MKNFKYKYVSDKNNKKVKTLLKEFLPWDEVDIVKIRIGDKEDSKTKDVYNFRNVAVEGDSMYSNYFGYSRDYNEDFEYEFDNLAEAIEHYKDSAETGILIIDNSNIPKESASLYMLQRINPHYKYNKEAYDSIKDLMTNNFICFKLSDDFSNVLSINDESDDDVSSFAYLIDNIIDLDLLVRNNKFIKFIYYSSNEDD